MIDDDLRRALMRSSRAVRYSCKWRTMCVETNRYAQIGLHGGYMGFRKQKTRPCESG